SPRLPPPSFEARFELLSFRQASEHLVEASHLLPNRLDRLGGFLRCPLRAGFLLPLLLCRVRVGLGFIRRFRRRLGGTGGSGRFMEQRQEGHRTGRRLEPRSITAHLLGLLQKSGSPFFDLSKLLSFRVLAAQPGECRLYVVPPLSRHCERLDDPGVL